MGKDWREPMSDRDEELLPYDLGNDLIRAWTEPGETKGHTAYHLDLRLFLEVGGEPYSIIMTRVAKLRPDEELSLHLPFEPRPLIAQLSRMGFQTRLIHRGTDYFCLEVRSTTSPI